MLLQKQYMRGDFKLVSVFVKEDDMDVAKEFINENIIKILYIEVDEKDATRMLPINLRLLSRPTTKPTGYILYATIDKLGKNQ